MTKHHRHIERDEADKILKPLYPTLYGAFEDAWNWVQGILEQDPDRRRTFGPSTVAAMVYERFVALLLPMVAGNPDIKVVKSGRMIRLRIANKITLRFKRLTNKLRSGNVRTQAQHDIYMNLLDVSDGATSVTFGYVVAKAVSAIRGVYVTCPKNWKENFWMIPLRDDAAGGMPLFTPAPLPPTLPLPDIGRRDTGTGKAAEGQ